MNTLELLWVSSVFFLYLISSIQEVEQSLTLHPFERADVTGCLFRASAWASV